MGKLGLLGRAAVEARHGVKGPASEAVEKNADLVKRMEGRQKLIDGPGGLVYNGIKVMVDDSMPFMAVLVSVGSKGIWLSTETLDVIRKRVQVRHFMDDVERWGPGMKYLVTEGGKYAEAAQREKDAGREIIPAIDPLTTLEQDANRLVVQAASMQDSPTESQLRLFAERLADLRARFEAIDAQRERAADLINLAAVAITDALE